MGDKNAKVYYINLFYSFTFLLLLLLFFLKLHVFALVFGENLAVSLTRRALVVEFFFYYHAVVVFGAAALRAARCGVLLLASGVVAVGVGVGAVAELLRHALHAQIEETDDADKEDGNHKHHDKYAFQK